MVDLSENIMDDNNSSHDECFVTSIRNIDITNVYVAFNRVDILRVDARSIANFFEIASIDLVYNTRLN